MSRLTSSARRPVVRVTNASYGGRAIVVGIHAGHLTLREKGRKTEYTLDIGAAYWRAVKEAVALEKKEKAAARKAQKGGK